MGLSLHCMISEVTNFQFSYSLSPGEGNGTPLQYSCLENPMDGGDWKAAVHGIAESKLHEARTWHNANNNDNQHWVFLSWRQVPAKHFKALFHRHPILAYGNISLGV